MREFYRNTQAAQGRLMCLFTLHAMLGQISGFSVHVCRTVLIFLFWEARHKSKKDLQYGISIVLTCRAPTLNLSSWIGKEKITFTKDMTLIWHDLGVHKARPIHDPLMCTHVERTCKYKRMPNTPCCIKPHTTNRFNTTNKAGFYAPVVLLTTRS